MTRRDQNIRGVPIALSPSYHFPFPDVIARFAAGTAEFSPTIGLTRPLEFQPPEALQVLFPSKI